jgi:benzoylformate decarboxylase
LPGDVRQPRLDRAADVPRLSPDCTYVLGLQEAVVVGMADGHAQASAQRGLRQPAFGRRRRPCDGQRSTRPSRTSTPLVITAGQQARPILPFDPFLHSAQATELPKPYVKWTASSPPAPQDVPLAIARAWHVAMSPPLRPGAGVDPGRRLGRA